MMTLDEAIKKYENIAKYHADPYSNGDWHYANKIMAEDYSQLAEWLKELKKLNEQENTILNKIKEEIKDNTYFINETTEKEGIDFETVEKIIDKYRAESEEA